MAYVGASSADIQFKSGGSPATLPIGATDEWEFSCRIKTGANFSSRRWIMGRGRDNDGGVGNWSIGFSVETTGKLAFYQVGSLPSAGGLTINGATTLSTDTEYTVGIYYKDSTKGMKIILNGSEDATGTSSFSSLRSSRDNFMIGVAIDTTIGSGEYWTGKISEAALWIGQQLSSGNRSDLTTKAPNNIGNTPSYYWPLWSDSRPNIGGIYGTREGSPTFSTTAMTLMSWPTADLQSSAIFNLNMDEAGTGSALDNSGNSRDFAATNAPTSETGKIGAHSRGFNGTDQFFSKAYAAALFPTDKVTIVGWFYTGSFAATQALITAGL
jgi:hypothetical protein